MKKGLWDFHFLRKKPEKWDHLWTWNISIGKVRLFQREETIQKEEQRVTTVREKNWAKKALFTAPWPCALGWASELIQPSGYLPPDFFLNVSVCSSHPVLFSLMHIHWRDFGKFSFEFTRSLAPEHLLLVIRSQAASSASALEAGLQILAFEPNAIIDSDFAGHREADLYNFLLGKI